MNVLRRRKERNREKPRRKETQEQPISSLKIILCALLINTERKPDWNGDSEYMKMKYARNSTAELAGDLGNGVLIATYQQKGDFYL